MRRFRARAGDVAALAAGAVTPLAFAPFELHAFAIVALAVLFALWRDVAPGRAAWHGWLFGLGLFGAGVNWVYISMNEFGGMSAQLSLALTTLFIAFIALFPAMAAFVAVRLVSGGRRRDGILPRYVAVFPASWTLFEWARGWFLTGFPWLNLGYSQIDAPLAGFAPLAGVYGVSLLAALSAALLVLLSFDAGRRAQAAALATLTVVWVSGSVLALVDWTRPAGAPLTVSMVQGNVPQDLKWHPGMRDATLEIYAALTREHWDSDLVVWPETAVPTFEHRARPFLDTLADEAREHGAELLVGVIHLDADTGRYYNSMITVAAETQGRYHKHHLVPFTEYLPFQSVLGDLVAFFDIPMSDFAAGEPRQAPLAIAGQHIALSICYEDAFGEEVIRALPEATVLVNVSNDAWFGDSIAPHQHLQIARMRAAETGRWLARATNTGVSAFIDPRGDLHSLAPQFELSVLTAAVEPRRGATLYVVVGNGLAIGLAVLMLAVVLLPRRAPPAA